MDFLTKIAGVSYEEADRQKVFVDVEGLQLPILHYLVLSKFTTGRHKAAAKLNRIEAARQRLNDS